MLNDCIELSATVLEGLLLFWTVRYIVPVTVPRRSYRLRFWISLFLFVLIVSIGNEIHLLSAVLVYVYFLVAILLIFWCSDSAWLLCAFSCVCTFLIFHTVDLSLNLIIGMLLDQSESAYASFWATMNPGAARIVFILIADLCKLILILSLRPLLRKIRTFSSKNLLLLLILMLSSHILLVFFMSQILTASASLQQLCIITAEWVILALSLLSVYSTDIASQRSRLLQEKELIASISDSISKSQIQQSDAIVSLHKQCHDQSRHLRTLLGFQDIGAKSRTYIEQLLSEDSSPSFLCDSGDPYVDAVVNCRLSDMKDFHIRFRYNFFIPNPLPFKASDICSLLANQLDNAIHACQNVPDGDRFIDLSVRQRHNTFLFDTENSYNPEAIKNVSNPRRHGFGLEIMRDIAERYYGQIDIQQRENTYIVHSTLQWIPEQDK